MIFFCHEKSRSEAFYTIDCSVQNSSSCMHPHSYSHTATILSYTMKEAKFTKRRRINQPLAGLLLQIANEKKVARRSLYRERPAVIDRWRRWNLHFFPCFPTRGGGDILRRHADGRRRQQAAKQGGTNPERLSL